MMRPAPPMHPTHRRKPARPAEGHRIERSPMHARALRSLILLLLGLWATPAWAADFYVDPVHGAMDNDGSRDAPWRTLQEVIEANLIESQEWSSLPYAEGATLVPKNPGAPVRAGDRLWLRSGDHGALVIQSYYNAAPIIIQGEPGASARLSSALIRSSSHWHLVNLDISLAYATDYEKKTLLAIENHNWRGPVHDIRVEDCRIASVADISPWTADDWNNLAGNGIRVDGANNFIANNHIKNVNFGISVSGPNAQIIGNTIENFSGDGLRGLGDHGLFEGNLVKNCYKTNDNHDDGFQSWSVGPDGVGSGEVHGIILRGNTIINYEDPDQPMRCTLQGIGCFDGTFVDWVIENNVIMVDHWHGITLMGARNSRIVNNTVVDLNQERPGPPWVRIANHKDGTPAQGCLVRNNLVTAINVEGDGVTVDHNLIVTDLAAHFVDPLAFDLRLLPTSTAIDAGAAEEAPSLDHAGVPRPQGLAVDVGAFEWHDGTWPPPEPEELRPEEAVEPAPEAVEAPDSAELGGDDTRPDPGSDASDMAEDLQADPPPPQRDQESCACRVAAPRPTAPRALGALALGLLALYLIRRRHQSQQH